MDVEAVSRQKGAALDLKIYNYAAVFSFLAFEQGLVALVLELQLLAISRELSDFNLLLHNLLSQSFAKTRLTRILDQEAMASASVAPLLLLEERVSPDSHALARVAC